MENFKKYSDIIIGVGIVVILVMLVLHLPTPFLDTLLIFNLGLSLVVFLVTLYIKEPVHFSIFPTLLLIFTLFRLALNVACCRAILLRGDLASNVIRSFGDFVVGGNYVIGLVIFFILVIIQYIVITNGSQRVAEVAARFTLDAMPGKQMSIDADLNTGLITEEEARQRRRKIEEEADFYGAMDGASKFVRGDAIAAIIIILVNIIGGFIIGVLQQRLSVIDALQTYILLTVGAGIAMQIPALLLSTATGVVVSRAATESDLGKELVGQIFSQPRAIMLAGIVLFPFIFVPNIPKFPFLLIASSLGAIAYTLKKVTIKTEEEKKRQQEKEILLKKKPESVVGILKLDTLELEVGYGLIPLVNPEQGGPLLDRITLIRRQLALDLGIIVPPIRVRDNVSLKPNEYSIKIKGVEVARGQVQLNYYLAINPGKVSEQIDGIATQEPVFKLPAFWITESQKAKAELCGYTVVDIPSIIATHLSEIIRTYSPEILTRQDVQNLIDNVKKENPVVVEELIPNLLSVGEVQKVLQELLRERISIRDLVTILESLADNARHTKDIDQLVEGARQALSRQICKQLQDENKFLNVITLDPHLEDLILENIKADQKLVTIEPDLIKKILDSVSSQLEKLLSLNLQPVILVSPQIRKAFRKLTERSFPHLYVLSYNEIPVDQQVRSFGVVSI